MSLSPAITQKIKVSVDIVALIKEYIPLKPAGRNFKTTCPFHSEKTPSFMVSPEKQIFHCFGCGAGGDTVTFLMKHEKLTFVEAIKVLAKKAGINIPEVKGEKPPYISKFYEIMETASSFYERYLFTQEGKAAWLYLTKRGLTMQEIKKFRIGFSPSAWDMLYRFLKGRGLSEKDMETVGLIIRRKEGGYYDRFRERIIYPIMNETGKIVAFGGRTIKEIEPKYLNSPETPIYRKGMVLYGLNFARRSITKEEKAIVVEGYMDLISLFQFGFDFSIATLGTALTPMHLRMLRRFSPELILAYDADKGGDEATFRGIEEALKLDFRIKVLELPRDNDPEEYLRAYGRDAMFMLIKDAPDFFSFRINALENIYSPGNNMDKIKIVRAMLSTLRYVAGELEKAEYLRMLSERYSIPEETLRIEIKNFRKDYDTDSAKTSLIPKNFFQEKEVMRLILSGGELSSKARRYLNAEDFEDENLREIMRQALKLEPGQELNIASFLDEITDEKQRSIVTGLLMEEAGEFSKDTFLDEFILKAIKKKRFKKSMVLLEEIKIEERNGNLSKVREKQREYEKLIKGEK